MRFVTPRMHAPVDYLLVLLFALAPTIFGFSGTPAVLSYIIAVGYLAMSLLTAYPLSLAKIIPFPVHGYVELVLGPVLALSPFILGFSRIESARNFFIALGIAVFLAWLTTDYRAAEEDTTQRHAGVRPRRHAAT
jgi:hypothetical protein